MYTSFTEWRNEIRAAEKALRLMKQAQSTPKIEVGGYWRSDLNRAVAELERTITKAKQSYDAERSSA